MYWQFARCRPNSPLTIYTYTYTGSSRGADQQSRRHVSWYNCTYVRINCLIIYAYTYNTSRQFVRLRPTSPLIIHTYIYIIYRQCAGPRPTRPPIIYTYIYMVYRQFVRRRPTKPSTCARSDSRRFPTNNIYIYIYGIQAVRAAQTNKTVDLRALGLTSFPVGTYQCTQINPYYVIFGGHSGK